MSATNDNNTVIIDDLCMVRFASGFTLATTDDEQSIISLHAKLAHRLSVSVDTRPVVVGEAESVGCGRYVVCSLPNTFDDAWETAFGTIWVPTRDEGIYVVGHVLLTLKANLVTLLWTGLMFVASESKADKGAMAAFGMMSLMGERE